MINRKRPDFVDHFWVLSEAPFSSNNIFSPKRKYKIKTIPPTIYTNSQYIMHELKNTHMFITCINPKGHVIKNKMENIMKTDTFIVIDSYDLSEISTWTSLWDIGVEMFEYSNIILKYLSSNDFYIPLTWYIDKIEQIKKDRYNKKELVKTILNEAIRNNNPDIIQYIAVEFGNDFSYLNDEPSIIESIYELAATQNVNHDYCIKVIRQLDEYKIFSSILYSDRILRIVFLLFEEMGHTECASIINKYLHDIAYE